jgi:zinc transport system ATP-binding protein
VSADSPIVVECRDLSFRYGKPVVLEDVSFTVPDGESLCVIGPNGGGKSTLMKLLLGLLEPNAGEIKILGKSPVKARSDIGYVPQAIRFDPLFPISALDIVLMGRLDRLGVGLFSGKCKREAEAALDEVGLVDIAHRSFSDLSGGQRQRVLIARALACDPKLLLLDEPTANIDLSVEEALLDSLEKLRERMTILLVTHDLDLVSRIGDSVLCVNHRVHRHSLPLSGETIREIYSGARRLEHDKRTRHIQGDHTACDHE